jgi:mRNA interferase RelE/StbE
VVDVLGEKAGAAIKQVDGEEPASARDKRAAIIRHAGSLGRRSERRNSLPLIAPYALWRTFVGDYRIVAAIEDDRFVVLVVAVGHRPEVYR